MSNEVEAKATWIVTKEECISFSIGFLLGGVLLWWATYSYFKENPLTPHRVLAVKLLSESKAQCEARVFTLKQLQLTDKCKPEDVKKLQLKYASTKASSDNLISVLSMAIVAGVGDKEQSLEVEIKKLQESSNAFIKEHDDMVNRIFRKPEQPVPYDPKNPNVQSQFGDVLDSLKLTYEIGKEIDAKKARSEDHILQLIQRQTMLGLHEFK